MGGRLNGDDRNLGAGLTTADTDQVATTPLDPTRVCTGAGDIFKARVTTYAGDGKATVRLVEQDADGVQSELLGQDCVVAAAGRWFVEFPGYDGAALGLRVVSLGTNTVVSLEGQWVTRANA